MASSLEDLAPRPVSPARRHAPAITYRSEIDGLRAIAVSSVVIFHFFPAYLPGGYLGVDVFFVISGFLIAGIILRQLRQGTFSFGGFYWKRVRRILPAAFVTVLVTSAVALLILSPPDLVRYLRSAIATLTFTSNIFFWRDGGYFGEADDFKPLLHMWSLAVEEQFYLFFPWIFVAIVRLSASTRVHVLCLLALTAGSFAIDIYLQRIGGGNPAFFLLPSRAWQFGIGILAALFYFEGERPPASPVMGWLAMAALVAGLFVQPPHLPAGLVVTLATGLLLAFPLRAGSRLNRVLGLAPLRFLGVISFSLYLWHWPIAAFLNYASITEASSAPRWLGLGLSILLAAITHRLVENPFRWTLSSRAVAGTLGGVTASVALLAVHGIAHDGYTGRFSPMVSALSSASQTNYRCPIASYFSYGASRACSVNPEGGGRASLAILGNSHAQMYVPAIAPYLREAGERAILVPLNACLPTTTVNISLACISAAAANLRAVASDPAIERVLVGMTWSMPRVVTAGGETVETDVPVALAEAVASLARALDEAGKEVFLIAPIQKPERNLASELGRDLIFGRIDEAEAVAALRVPRQAFSARFGRALDELEAAFGPRLVRPDRLLCDDEACVFGSADALFFSDDNHLGRDGALHVSPAFEAVLGR